MANDTVYNVFNAPIGQSSPHGEHVYSWEFLDENGKIQTDSKNMKEYINSFLPRVDYKKQIERGEIELNDSVGVVSKDYRGIPDNTVDIYKYLVNLASLSPDEVTKRLEQVRKASETKLQEKPTTNQGGTKADENSPELKKSEPGLDTSSGTLNAGGQN